MGNEQSQIQQRKSRADTEMTRVSVSTAVYINPQETETHNCCGIVSVRPKKETWKVNFQQYCTQLSPHYKWVSPISTTYQQCLELPRVEYLKQMNSLRYQLLQAPKFYDSKVINLQQIMDKSILFSAELFKSMSSNKPIQIETKTTASFSRMRKKSILITQNERRRTVHKREAKVSALDESLRELFKAKENQKLNEEAANQLKTFVRFCEILQKHLHDQKHPLTQLKLTFTKYILRQYSSLSQHSLPSQPLTKDLQQFIQLLKQLVWDFYRVEMLQQLFPLCKLISSQNLTNAVSSIIFKDETISSTVTRAYNYAYKKDQENLLRVLSTKARISPEDMGVNDQYCLNKRTIDWHMEQLSAESLVENMDVSVVMDFSPYEKCIVKLKQLESTHTPIAKLKVIVSCAEKIQSCISQFYHLNALPIKASIVDADQILSIFSFILVCSHVSNVYTHLHIIQNFASKQQLKSMTGYYYNVILSAVTHLQKMDDREFSFR